MRFSEFADEMLVALYRESELTPNTTFSSAHMLDHYPLRWREGWVYQLVDEFGSRGLIYGKGTIGDERSQPLRLTARGLREAERLMDEGVGIFRLEEAEPAKGVGYDDAVARASEEPTEMESLEAQLAPASDRDVQFDHNSRNLNESIEKLEESLPAIEGSNEPEMVEIAVHARTGVEFLKRCRDRTVAASVRLIRYLVINPFKRALESSLDDGWKLVIQTGLVLLLSALLGLLGIVF